MASASVRAVPALLALCLCRTVAAQDREQEPPERLPRIDAPRERPEGERRRQSVDFSYRFNLDYPEHLDRQNVADLAMAPMDLVHLALLDRGDDPFYFRLPKWALATIVDGAVLYAAHEYGHVSSISKSGYRHVVFGNKDSYLGDQDGTSPWALFLEGLHGGSGKAVSVSNEDWSRIGAEFAGRPELQKSFIIAMKAGGLNQEMVIRQRYAERLWEGGLSPLDTIPVGLTAISTLTYPVHMEMSDVADYASLLGEQGLETSPSRIRWLSAISLLSGSTLASFWGAALGLTGAEATEVRPWILSPAEGLDLSLPEISSLLSEFGPTLQFSVRARAAGLQVRPSYEQLFVGGASMGEYGLEVKVPIVGFLSWEGAAYRNTEGGWWQETGVELSPWPWLALGLGGAWGRAYTFHRDLYGSGNDLLEERERSLIVSLGLRHRF